MQTASQLADDAEWLRKLCPSSSAFPGYVQVPVGPDLRTRLHAIADRLTDCARLRERVKELEGALSQIGEYTGDGPPTTPWRDIVRECGATARAALPPAAPQ